jgi:hypothetical protein
MCALKISMIKTRKFPSNNTPQDDKTTTVDEKEVIWG